MNTNTSKTSTTSGNATGSNIGIRMKQKYKTIFAYFCILLAVISVILYYTNKKTNLSAGSKYYTYLLFIIIPILIGIITLMTDTITNVSNLIIPMLAMISAILFAYYVLAELSDQVWGIVNFILLILFILLALAIIYKLFVRYLNTFTGWWGFIVKFIFYIPCLITDFIGYLIHDFNNTPKIIGIVFLLQVSVILLYFLVPYIYRLLKSANIITLVHKPIYLTRRSIVCDNDMLKKNEPFFWFRKKIQRDLIYPNGNNGDLYLKNYSISMWIFVNEDNGGSSKELPLFRYGNSHTPEVYGKPSITFNPNSRDKNHKYSVYFSDRNANDYSQYDFSLIPQKWNYVVITYNNNIVDFFLNGKLETSYRYKKTEEEPQFSNLPEYTLQDNITVGYGGPDTVERGINGAICNVEYRKIPMTKTEVQSNYKIYKNTNPPVNW